MKETLFIPVKDIKPNRYQPRLEFDEKLIEELSASILEHGLIQPVTVRYVDDQYELIAGERRLRASIKAGLEEIPCYVMSPGEDEAAQLALIENVQRENLSAIEEARAYVQIMRQAKLTQEQVAQRIGKSQSSVANKIRLLNLPQEIQNSVLNHEITERHARALLALSGEEQQNMYKEIVEHELTVRETEKLIEEKKESKPSKKRKQKTKGFTRNIQIAINSINQCVAMIGKLGIEVTTDVKENEDDVSVILRIKR
ncbi:MAG: nucleoid occlusion protein [Erysipelotrichaceae bacterium]|nr:nucleoid occlusion protein [Erysipelotrichaceae bacterium]